ncbi:MAG TPA: serine-rich protein [Anaerolineae bacterium]|nr:serine-rich protein [Anaerolineae bacterium]
MWNSLKGFINQARLPRTPSSDLFVLNNGSVFEDGKLDHLWYEVEMLHEGQVLHGYKVAILRELWALPAPPRDDRLKEPDILDRTRTMLRGLYNARVDMIYVAAGMFGQPRLGVVQMYGVTCFAEDLDLAVRRARSDITGVEATMANFLASVTRPLDADRTRFVTEAITSYRHALVVLGQPDPREATTISDKPAVARSTSEKPAEQNEQFFRAMSRVGEDFVFFVLGSRLPRRRAAQLLEAAAHEASLHLGRSEGHTSISAGIGLPIIFNRILGDAASTGYGESQAQGQADGESHSEGQAHTDSWSQAHTVGRFQSRSEMWGESETWGESHSVGVGHTEGQADSVGQAHTEGHAVTDGQAHTEGQSWSSGESWAAGGSDTVGHSAAVGQSQAVSQQASLGSSLSHTDGQSQVDTQSEGWSLAHGASMNQGGNVGAGIPGLLNAGGNASVAESYVGTESDGASHAQGASASDGVSLSQQIGVGQSHGVNASQGVSESHTENWSAGGFSSQGGMASDTVSHAETRSTADTESRSHTESESDSSAESWGTMHATSKSHAVGVSEGESEAWSNSVGGADTESKAWSKSHADSQAQGTAISRAIGQSSAVGAAAGLSPNVSLSKSFRWQDMNETFLAQFFQKMVRLLDTISAEGGYLVDAFVLTRNEAGLKAAEAAVTQAFHGLEDVVTPVITVALNDDERTHIRDHALTFTPCTLPAADVLTSVMGGGRYETLNSLHQTSCLVAPSVFEEGTAATIRPRPPRFAYLPELKGDVLLGYQFSRENYDATTPTTAACTLAQEGFFSTAFLGDTGVGKSVAAERLVYESTLKWQLRSLVFDFGKGWERLVNAPGLEGHAQVFHLTPTGIRPLRWNPLQISQRIDPRTQRDAIVEIYAGVTGMGQRQLGYLHETLRELYIDLGVLLDERDVVLDSVRNHVAPDEEEAINRARLAADQHPRATGGLPVTDLRPKERQALSVYRSRLASMEDWHARLEKKHREAKGSPADQQALKGVLLRLQGFLDPDAQRAYGPGDDTLPLEDVSLPWGLTVFAGGAGLGEMAKAFLIGYIAWILHSDAVKRTEETGSMPYRGMHIFIDEINKLFGGAIATGSSQSGSGQQLNGSESLIRLWPDCRKYGIAMSFAAQSPALLPERVWSSCNNFLIFRLKNAADRDISTVVLGRSEKGLRDVDTSLYIATMPEQRSLTLLGYRNPYGEYGLEPMLIQPALVPGRAETEIEMAAQYGVQMW